MWESFKKSESPGPCGYHILAASKPAQSFLQLHSRRIPETLTAPTLQLCSLSLCLPTHIHTVFLPLSPRSCFLFPISGRKFTLLGSQSLSMIAPPTFHLCFPSYTLNGVVRRKGFSIRLLAV